ncbi:MAG: hypothetical protein U1E76_18810, partial [Planctomycetota bacterium]
MKRGDYGYDAPYALVIFGILSIASALDAAMLWRDGPHRAAARMTVLSLFFFANTTSFLYTTRRGKFRE